MKGDNPKKFSLNWQLIQNFFITLFPILVRCKISVANPDPDPGSGIGCFLTPGSGIRDGRKSASGSGIRYEQPGSYFFRNLKPFFFAFFGVKILKFFDEDPGSGMETVRIRDPGSGMEKSRIRDPG
jgi:hypothetical protein